MGTFKNIGLKDYLKRYGIKNAFSRGLFTANPIHIVKDYENKKILYYKKIYKLIQKNYDKYREIDPVGLVFPEKKVENAIWIYWKQGLDQAPLIVKRSIQSILEKSENQVVIITDDNLSEYVSFPTHIVEKALNGNMSPAAFSDLLRFSLLEHYGGTWIDATVFLTERIPQYILNSEFFAFRDSFGLIDNPALFSVWFLHSSKGNKIIRETRNITFAYWKNNKYVKEYLLPYIILTFVLNCYPNYRDKIPYAVSEYSHLLFEKLYLPYCESEFEYIKKLANVHKLSYKLSDEVLNDTNNYYHKLICDK